MNLPAPNRIAVYVAGLASLLTALAPLIADLDTSSTLALVGGLVGLVTTVVTWLIGWQRHEMREAWVDTLSTEPGDIVVENTPDPMA